MNSETKLLLIIAFLLLFLTGCFKESSYKKAVKVYNSNAENRHKVALDLLLAINSSDKHFNQAFNLIEEVIRDDIETNYKDSLIAYIDKNYKLAVMSPDGSNRKVIVNRGDCSAPRWSPDGSKIVFSGRLDYAETWGVHIVNRDGSGLEIIDREHDYRRKTVNPVWSRDGKSIFYNYAGHIHNYDLQKGVKSKLLISGYDSSKGEAFNLEPLPDGKSYLFIYDRMINILEEGSGFKRAPLPFKDDVSLLTGFYERVSASTKDGLYAITKSRSKLIIVDTNQKYAQLIYGGVSSWSYDNKYIISDASDNELYIKYIYMDELSKVSEESSTLIEDSRAYLGVGPGEFPAWSPSL